MEFSSRQFDTEFSRVYESLQDLGKENVLYHYTSIVSLFEILESGVLLPQSYGLNAVGDSEIAVTRSKRPLSTIEKNEVRISLFADRVRTLRGVKVSGINEAEFEQRKDYEASVRKLLRLAPYRQPGGYAKVLYSKREELLGDSDKALDAISELCMMDRRAISQRDLEDFLINLTQYAMIRNKEYGNQFEERIRTKTGIPVDEDYLEITLLKGSVVEIPEGLTDEDCAALVKANAKVFVKDDKFNELISSLVSTPVKQKKKRDLSAYSSEALRKKYPAMFRSEEDEFRADFREDRKAQ